MVNRYLCARAVLLESCARFPRPLIVRWIGKISIFLKGIGSDASYNPSSGGYGGGSGAGGGLRTDELTGQIGQIGQKSMRFLSDSFATLQTGVEKTAHTLEEQKIGQTLR